MSDQDSGVMHQGVNKVMGSDNEHASVWDVKSSETLIQPTRGNGEYMGGESVYQIQVSWTSMKEHSSVKVASWKSF